MDTAGGRAVSHRTDQPQRRAFSQSLKSGSCPCRNVLGPVNVTLYRITPTSHMWSDYLHFKTSNGTVFGGGGGKGSGWGWKRRGRKWRERKMQLWFLHFSLQARMADLPLLLPFHPPPHPPLLTWCCCIIDSSKIQFLSTISASIPKRHLEWGQKGGSINKTDQIVSGSVAPACSMQPPLCHLVSNLCKTDVISIVHI